MGQAAPLSLRLASLPSPLGPPASQARGGGLKPHTNSETELSFLHLSLPGLCPKAPAWLECPFPPLW